MFFDPLYLIVVVGLGLLGGWAQMRVRAAYAETARIPNAAGMTGAEAAARMLHAHEVPGARVVRGSGGDLSDHYDPRSCTLRLSPDVYDGRSVAALGIACHEAGHAIQHAQHYGPLVIRNLAVPVANIGSSAGFLLMIIGAMAGLFGLALLGFVLFSAVVVFQLINLPVEFDASNRAKRALGELGIVRSGGEAAGVSRVLNAAAWTYVAATVAAIVWLLYFALRLGLFNRR